MNTTELNTKAIAQAKAIYAECANGCTYEEHDYCSTCYDRIMCEVDFNDWTELGL